MSKPPVRGRSLLFAVALLASLFAVLTALVLEADLQPTAWDRELTLLAQSLPPILGELLIWVSWPGFFPWSMIFYFLPILLFALRRLYREAAFTALAGLGGVLSEICKQLVARPRPSPELIPYIYRELTSYSFPSGHVTGYTLLLGFLFYLAYTQMPRHSPWRRLALISAALVILLVGPSRVYMGQHWASDALAGYALGFSALFLLIEGYRYGLHRGQGSGVGDQSRSF